MKTKNCVREGNRVKNKFERVLERETQKTDWYNENVKRTTLTEDEVMQKFMYRRLKWWRKTKVKEWGKENMKGKNIA